MKPGDIRRFSKSGNLVRLVSPDRTVLGGTRVNCWVVERVDSGKRMLCPTCTLIAGNEWKSATDEGVSAA